VGSILEEMKEITQYLKSLLDHIDKILASVPVCWCWLPLEHSEHSTEFFFSFFSMFDLA
jgi:hypothetical protein